MYTNNYLPKKIILTGTGSLFYSNICIIETWSILISKEQFVAHIDRFRKQAREYKYPS